MRRPPLICLAVVCVLGSGCGAAVKGASTPSTPATGPHTVSARLIAAAAGSVRSAGSARMRLTMHTADGLGNTFTITAVGVFTTREPVSGSLSMTIATPQLPHPLRMQELMTSRAIYLRMPAALHLPHRRPWIELSLAGRAGAGLRALESSGNQNPAAALSYLEGVGGSVVDLGPARAGRVATTRYRVVVDLRRVIAQTPAATRPAVRRLYDRVIGELGSSAFPIQVWLDGAGRPRRLAYSLDMTTGVTLTLNCVISDYGVAVDLAPPPPALVQRLPVTGPAAAALRAFA